LDDLKTKALLLSIEMSDLNSMPRKQVSKLQNMISTILVSIGQVLEAQLGESPNNEEMEAGSITVGCCSIMFTL